MIIIIIFLFILLNIIMDQYYKKKFIAEKFPPNILFEIKDDIELPKIEEGENIPKKKYIVVIQLVKVLKNLIKYLK
jgi:hypothetical protein